MATIDIQAILNSLKEGVLHLAQGTVKDFVGQAKADGEATINAMKEELKDWGTQLLNGEITEGDLKDLIAGRQDLLKMEALKQAGIAAIELDNFKSGLIDLITKTISKAI